MSSERFATLIQVNQENELFRFSYGEALFDEGKFEDCLSHLEFCVGKKSDWMIPQILLGKAMIALNRKEEAIPFLEKALQLARDQNHEDPEAEVEGLLDDIRLTP
ncbi:MAG: molecular chaperone DnaJ [Opitutaceae bacterium]|nr:molecular chaperone DnaJ [Opitutaceae bacterium]|tara:strand:- start:4647 stop:4961 length:315 start_codon:yes stop_codon:yes gene_type:complete